MPHRGELDARASAQSPGARVFTVTELTAQIHEVLSAFPPLWVAGEVSGVRRPASGHVYFTLKDAESVIAAVMWKGQARRLPFDLTDGLEVVVRGQLDLYPPRGSYQIVCWEIEPKGVGVHELAMRQLVERLRAEGLLDSERKRALPAAPTCIGLVTSVSGAAIRDILAILRRRWPGARVVVAGVRVQGDAAPGEIAAGIAALGRVPGLDVMIVGRGGGSAEDLSAWNDEGVARAIVASPVPVVSAVGHEVDVTVADLVADVRAATPSEAAELVAPDRTELLAETASLEGRLARALTGRLDAARAQVDRLAGSWGLRHPAERLRALVQQADDLAARLGVGVRSALRTGGERLAGAAGRLDSLSPLAVLARGYAVVQRLPEGSAVTNAASVPPGTALRLRLARGTLLARAESAEPGAPPG